MLYLQGIRFLILYIFIFTGSVFLTSSKNENEQNVPKLYFVIVTLLTFIAITVIHSKRLKPIVSLDRKILYCGIYLACFIQAW